MRPVLLKYAALFVGTTLLLTTLFRMSASASYASRVSLVLKFYLAILIGVEVVALARLHRGEPLHRVCDFIATEKDAAFTSLFAAYLHLLTASRAVALLAPPLQRHAWLACALTHALEALYVVPLAFAEGAVPRSWQALEARHFPAAFITFFVAVNGYLFSCVAVQAWCQSQWQTSDAGGSGEAGAAAQAGAVAVQKKAQ